MMNMMQADQENSAKRSQEYREHAVLVKVAEKAALVSEFLHGACLDTGGSKIHQMLEEALNELDEVVK